MLKIQSSGVFPPHQRSLTSQADLGNEIWIFTKHIFKKTTEGEKRICFVRIWVDDITRGT